MRPRAWPLNPSRLQVFSIVMSLAPGRRIGPYEVIAPLSAGGMGEVYRARDTNLDRDVALKILPEAFADDGERLERFKREAPAPERSRGSAPK